MSRPHQVGDYLRFTSEFVNFDLIGIKPGNKIRTLIKNPNDKLIFKVVGLTPEDEGLIIDSLTTGHKNVINRTWDGYKRRLGWGDYPFELVDKFMVAVHEAIRTDE